MPLILDNPVRTYAWGSPTVIPDLLGVPPSGEPQAELWMGAHPAAPSIAEIGGERVSLAELIEKDPPGMLGAEVVERFGPRLPYLLKILAVERPLSIQAHPNGEQAAQGFAAEEAAGVPLDAVHRSYRDRSHKPEMVVALTEFEALLGFRDPARSADLIDTLDVPDLRTASVRLRDDGAAALGSTVRRWLELSDAEAAALAGAVSAAAGATGDAGERATDPAADLFAGLVRRLARWYPGDRGILLALLLEHVRLSPGEAAFTPAGVPHAHLSGVAIEAQASSDNTLRAGLTPKHVDAAELMRVLRYGPTGDPRVTPAAAGPHESVYAPGVAEFRLSRIALDGAELPLDSTAVASGARTVLVTDGAVDLAASGTTVRLRPGRAAFVPAAAGPARLAGRGTCFVVTPDLRAAGTAH